MAISSWLSWPISHSHARRGQRHSPATTSSHRRHTFRPGLEGLEIRLTLSLTTLAAFGGFPNGSNPVGGVIMDSSGNLYGTTYLGGANRDGTVFEVAQGSGAITTLATFNGTNGANPDASLIMDSSGNLYGTTVYGGASGDGTVFEVAKGSGTITTLASFNGTNGKDPAGGVIMDSSGNLYGTTSAGGLSNHGTVFELAHGSSTITTLAKFDGPGGYCPHGVIMDSSGNLYGTTSGGGDPDACAVWELAQGSHTITTLAWINGTNGSEPLGGLIMDSSGDLYGTASQGGRPYGGDGTVFEWVHGSHQINALARFNGTDGSEPVAGLIMDSSGNLFGTTEYGGASGDGTVFEVAAATGAITTLVSFNGTNGYYPEDALIMDSSGNLYGTTAYGGASGDGTVFELTGADALPALQLSGLRASTGAGASRAFTVTVPNAVGTTGNGHARTVDFTSTDRTANPAANDTAPDMGTDPFNGVVPQKKVKSSITDTLFSSITGSLSADGS